MALNIKNPEVERLAAEAAKLARESKAETLNVLTRRLPGDPHPMLAV